MWIRGSLLVLFGYLLAPCRSACWWRRRSTRDWTCGRPGPATSARRTWPAPSQGRGGLTLLLDAGKGIFALALARIFLDGPAYPWLALVGGAVFLGHIFPSTSASGGEGGGHRLRVVLFLSPETAFVLVVLFAAVLYFTATSLSARSAPPSASRWRWRSSQAREYVTLSSSWGSW